MLRVVVWCLVDAFAEPPARVIVFLVVAPPAEVLVLIYCCIRQFSLFSLVREVEF